MVRPKLYVC